MENVIETVGLERSFGEVKAVRGVDLTVTSGEIYGFLGPNGAGKSTVVKMLTTLLTPTAGSAKVLGYDCLLYTSPSPRDRTRSRMPSSA